MKLSFDLQEEDLHLAQRVATKALQKASAHWTTTALGIVHWMCVGAFVVCVLDLAQGGSRTAVLVLGFAMIGSLWLVSYCQAWRMHARYRMQMGPYPHHHALVADDTGLTVASASGTIALPWSEIRELQSTPGHVFLLCGSGACFPIPQRAFGDDGARAGFIAAVAAFRSNAATANATAA